LWDCITLLVVLINPNIFKVDLSEIFMEKDPNKIIPLVIIVCVLLFVFIFIVVPNYNGQKSITGNTITSSGQQKICRDVQVPYDYEEEYIDTVPYSEEICESEELTYNLRDFKVSYNSCLKTEDRCLKYILGICSQKETYCTNKRIQCNLEITNLDDERGYWGIEFEFVSKDDYTNVLDTSSTGASLYPQGTEIFYGTGNFYGEEEANKEYTCRYKVTSTPEKSVCRDVTKYKEVTRMRTITKYRTEEKCD